MQLNPAAFNAHLAHMGQDLIWRQAFACPCRDPNSGAGKKGCPNCQSVGVFWGDGIAASAATSGQKAQQHWQQFGLYQNGDVVVTIPENSPIYDIGQYDRVTMLNSSDPFSIPLVRGKDRITGVVQSIYRCFWLDEGGVVVDGALPAIAQDGSLSWQTGGPPANTGYTVCGTKLKEYFCFGPFTQDRGMHHGARLPRKVVLRLFDLFGRRAK